MGRPELGTKCTCTGCSERFYDLNRSPAICPKCGAQQAPPKPRVQRPTRVVADNRRPHPVLAPLVADDDIAPVSTSESEEEDEMIDAEDEIDDDIDIDTAHEKTPD